ncbi:MAG: MATE family efflux transporter, partial [Pseudomonadota bacterium]
MDQTSADTTPTQRPFKVTHGLVLSIAVPMTFAYLTTPLLGLVDMAVVGRLGDAALIGGLAVGAIIFDVVFATLNFLRFATTGLVAQAFGRGDRAEEQAVFWRSLVIGIACGLAILALTPLIAHIGIWALAPEVDVQGAASTYISIRMVSAPATLSNYAILGFLLGRGQAVSALLLQTLINGINIALSIYLGLVLELGVAGVAWATVTGEIIGAVVGFAVINLRFDRNNRPSLALVFNRPSFLRLMTLNRDIMIRSMALLLVLALFVRQGAQFGAITLAANAILFKFFMVAGYYLDGFANAAEQLAGRAIGANHRPSFDRAVRLNVLWGTGLAALTTLFFLLFGGTVVDLMTTAESVREEARHYIVWAAMTALAGV